MALYKCRLMALYKCRLDWINISCFWVGSLSKCGSDTHGTHNNDLLKWPLTLAMCHGTHLKRSYASFVLSPKGLALTIVQRVTPQTLFYYICCTPLYIWYNRNTPIHSTWHRLKVFSQSATDKIPQDLLGRLRHLSCLNKVMCLLSE